MALTATVSPIMQTDIMQSLNICSDDTVVIERLPNKPNNRYSVHVVPKDEQTLLSPVIADVAKRGKHAKKTQSFSVVHMVTLMTLVHCTIVVLCTYLPQMVETTPYARCFLRLSMK